MDLVVLEADERQRADVDVLARAVGLADREVELERARRRRLEAEAVLVVLGGDVAGEGVEAVGPPEAGAVVVRRTAAPAWAAACRGAAPTARLRSRTL